MEAAEEIIQIDKTVLGDKQIKKYLQRCSTKHCLFSIPARTYAVIIVIPVYAELEYLPKTLESLTENTSLLDDTLVILVVNNPPVNDCDPGKLHENQDLLGLLNKGRFSHQSSLNLCWVDASSESFEIPGNGGVGMARKIGMDIALTHLDWTKDPLLLCLDADSPVKKNYLEAVVDFYRKNKSYAGAAVDYRHDFGNSSAQNIAIADYELFLRYYVLGLKIAGSPYAYHSIGSTMTCRATSYIKAGGMKIRNGGEDFYFLQALRKNGAIGIINDTCVYPSSRISDRVPFGTGPQINDILSGKRQGYYHPEIFRSLELLYCLLESVSLKDFKLLNKIFQNELPKQLCLYLDECNFNNTWDGIYINTPKNKLKLTFAFHTWFDAFRTLKFIHFCRDRFPDLFPTIFNAFDAFNMLECDIPIRLKDDRLALLELIRGKN